MASVTPLISQEEKDFQAKRWEGVHRPYTAEDVDRARGSIKIDYTLANLGARRLWDLITTEDYVNARGALTGGQAMQMVRAGLKAIYCSGWQVAADANISGNTYPDQSLYPANSVPQLVKRINASLSRADQVEHAEGGAKRQWFAPIVADAEAGFGGPLNAFELMKGMIEAGAAGVHFEDQLSSEKKCGHLGGKVLVPTRSSSAPWTAARLAADVCDVPTVLIARTDADSARLLTSDIDDRDKEFCTGERTAEGFYRSLVASTKQSHVALLTHHTATLSGVRLLLLASTKRRSSPKRSRRSTRTRCSATTALLRSTGRRTSTMQPSRSSSVSSVQWATSSSSLPWQASTHSTWECSSSQVDTKRAAWLLTLHSKKRNSHQRRTATQQPVTSVKLVPVTSTPFQTSSLQASHLHWHSKIRQKQLSSKLRLY